MIADTEQNSVACFHFLDHNSHSTIATGAATALCRHRNARAADSPG